jgi:hypothetical protein
MERMLRELDHWAVKADDIQEVAQALGELYARWVKNDLADSDKPTPYTTLNAVQTIYSWTSRLLTRIDG